MEESKNKCGERIEKRRGERKDRTGQDRTGQDRIAEIVNQRGFYSIVAL